MYPGPLALHPIVPDVLGLSIRATGPHLRARRRPTPATTGDATTPRVPPRGEVA
jgi:hypothetical protein